MSNKDRFDEEECRSVIRRLRVYRDDLDTLMNLLYEHPNPSKSLQVALRDRLKVLKDEVKAEAKRVGTAAGRGSLTQAESAFYAPAVSKASAYLPKINLHPSKWIHEGLYTVNSDIRDFLSTLEEWFPDE